METSILSIKVAHELSTVHKGDTEDWVWYACKILPGDTFWLRNTSLIVSETRFMVMAGQGPTLIFERNTCIYCI
ncbi:1147_t:CDS:2 [Funneliformis mosseae]|uniref:1147_t:CDS:1 n=1 Tax=Funneliformis mosseae TaxID=27381 RepID=A0A9N9HJ06_FUNMO|nr:1147_t:CDS:2 [Funneliformis mosseae]